MIFFIRLYLILYLISIVFSNEVNNKDIRYVTLSGDYPVYDKRYKFIEKTKFGNNAEVNLNKVALIDEDIYYKANKDGKIVYIPEDSIIDKNTIKEYMNYIKPKYDILNSNLELYDNNSKEFLKCYNLDININLSDNEKLKEIINKILKLNLKYENSEIEDLSKNLGLGKTNCEGISLIQRKLLDKTGITYRVIYQHPINLETKKISEEIPGHVSIEVKINNKWYEFEGTDIIGRQDIKNNTADKIYNSILASEIKTEKDRNILVEHNNEYNGTIFMVSSPRVNGKYLGDKTDIIYIPYISLEDYAKIRKDNKEIINETEF